MPTKATIAFISRLFSSLKNHTTSAAMTQLCTGSQCYRPRFCQMEYYHGLSPLSKSDSDMAWLTKEF